LILIQSPSILAKLNAFVGILFMPRSGMRRHRLWMTLAIAVLVVDVIAGILVTRRQTLFHAEISQSYLVLLQLQAILSSLQDMETGQRGYLLTGDHDFLEPYLRGRRQLDGQIDQALRTSRNNPEHYQNLLKLRAAASTRTITLEENLNIFEAEGLDPARAHVRLGYGKREMDSVRALIGGLIRDERNRLDSRLHRASQYSQFMLISLLGGAVAVVLLLIWCFVLLTRELKGRAERTRDLERRVEERTRRLTEVNQELEAFCYSVSHDLRAPLRSISGFSEALLEDLGPRLEEQECDYLRRVVAASKRMGVLIDDLLNLSRVSREEVRKDELDLSAEAQAVAEECRRGGEYDGVAVEIQPQLTAKGDRRLIRIALVNLIDNAFKFTRPVEAPRIQVSQVAEQNGERIFCVTDNGVGFDMEYVHKLFSPFQRLHRPQDFEGTGIGLAIVRRVVQRHGGRVWAESIPGQGTRMYFTLPKEDSIHAG